MVNGMAEAVINWEEKYLSAQEQLLKRLGDEISGFREDQRQLRTELKTQVDRMETKVDRLEVKVDRFYWFLVGILGTAIGSLVVAIISLVKHP